MQVIRISNFDNNKLSPVENFIIQSVFNTESLEIITNDNIQVLLNANNNIIQSVFNMQGLEFICNDNLQYLT